MKFGSNEFINYFRGELENGVDDSELCYELYNVLKSAAYSHIRKRVPLDYVDDVFHDVFLAVWKSLGKYIANSENMTEAQRIKWLYIVVECRIASFYKKYYKQPHNTIPLDDIQVEDETLDLDKLGEFTKVMEEVLCELFRINTSPEKIIAYVYSKVILSNVDGVNGKVKDTATYLTGRTLYSIYSDMKAKLQATLNTEIEDSVYIELIEKLDKCSSDGELFGNMLFNLNVKKITDGNNRIQKKLDRFWKEKELCAIS